MILQICSQALKLRKWPNFLTINLIYLFTKAFSKKKAIYFSSIHYFNALLILSSRGFFSNEKVNTAASVVDDYLINNNYVIDQDGKQQLLKKEGVLLSGFRPVTHHEKFL